MVGESPVGVHASGNDLSQRVGLHRVHPLEGGHDRLFGCGQRRCARREPGVAAGLGACLVEPGPQHGEGTLTAGRDLRGVLVELVARPRPPVTRLETPVVEPEDKLPHRGRVDPDDVGPGADHRLGLVRGYVQAGHVERDRDPRTGSLAQDLDELLPGRTVVVHPVKGGPDQAAGLGLGGRPAIRLPEELCLEAQVDRARGDVHRQGLGRQLVLSQRDGEGQGDACRQAVPVAADPPLDDGRGKGDTRAVHPGHPEQSK